MADWVENGGPVERDNSSALSSSNRSSAVPTDSAADTHPFSWLESLANFPLTKLITVWLGTIVAFGFVYWLAGLTMGWGLHAGSSTIKTDLSGFGTALYFSFVTALSIGYGDVIPVGPVRVLAIIEGIGGLLLFGCVISKLVSRRQEELTEEIHHTTFEDRLDRVRTNLHLVFSDLGSVQQLQAEGGALPELVLRRLESTVRVFRGELQTIYDLLYRARIVPGEEALESLLANLTICLQALVDIRESSKDGHSPALDTGLRALGSLAREICGECVPRVYAPELKEAMDQIQVLAARLV